MAPDKKTPEQRLFILEHNDERHFAHIKDINTKIENIDKKLQSIVDLLGGSELNNKKGFVYTVDKTAEKIEAIIAKVDRHEEKINVHHWWGTRLALALIGGITGLIIKTFSGS